MTPIRKQLEEMIEHDVRGRPDWTGLQRPSFRDGANLLLEDFCRMYEALEFYAVKDTWINYGTKALEDGGDGAREALTDIRKRLEGKE